jgi:glycine/D-amino acid oxidase-like deaminating enzyme
MPANIVIVGAGIMGLAAGWALARRRIRVTILDQAEIPNPKASSYDDHRLIRAAYGGHAGYTRLAMEAGSAWATLERDTGERLYAPTGVLALAAPGDSWARQSAAALAAAGVGVREMTPATIARRFPLLTGDGIETAFLLDDGGVLFARQALFALARRVEAHGGILRSNCPAAAIDAERGRVSLAGGGVVEGDLVIVAAGAWAPRLLPGLARRVTPSRQPVVYLRPPPGAAAAWAAMPTVLEIDPGAGFYAVPPAGGARLKVGTHRFTHTGDPDESREASAAEVAGILAACGARLRDFGAYAVERRAACYYAMERDERFIVEPLGPRGWVMAACSGHGFKFAPLLALELAEVLAGERDARAFTARAAGHA